MSSSKIDAVIFDIGNVLLSFDFGIAVARIAPFCSLPASEIPGRLEPLKIDLETGRIGGDRFLSDVISAIGYAGDDATLRSAWQEIFTPIGATHQLVHLWAKTLPVYLLSNTNDIHAEYFLERYEVFSLFKDRVFSHEVGAMKPDPAIYAHAVEKFGLTPSRTLFIDDLKPNVEAAEAAGWVVHHYTQSEHQALVSQAERLGLL